MPAGASRRRHVFALGVLVVLTTVVSALAVFANPPADEWLYLQVRAQGWLSALDGLDVLGGASVVAGLSLLAFVAWRCRALLVGTLLALVTAFSVSVVLTWVAGRERPFDSALSGQDSFPSPAVAVLAVLALLVPYGLWVTFGNRAVVALGGVVLWVLTVTVGLQEVHGAERWPFDVLGAILIAATAAVATLAVVTTPSRLHARCSGCPWQGAQTTARRPAAEVGGRKHPLYRAALVWSIVLAVGFGVLALRQGIPRLPESGVMGTGLEVPLNVALVVLIVIGVLVAARWHLTGAVMVAAFALLLGYMSSVHYAPWIAVLVAAVAFAPALLLWVQWHRAASARAALTVAVAVAAGFGVMIYFAASTYGSFWGPTHATSVTPRQPDDRVTWMWAGAVTDTSFTVKARTDEDHDAVRLLVSTEPELTEPAYSEPVPSRSAETNIVALAATGLEPGSDYYYALDLDGEVVDDRVGHVETFPRGPASFTFAVASCSRTGSNGVVYDAIRRSEPLLYINDGDWFYGDVERNDVELFRRQYEANLASPAQAELYASTAFAYVWDDHDSHGNDADRYGAAWPAAMEIFRTYVPHYELRDGPEAPVFQAFTVGDVRFVMTDPRSQRDPRAEVPTMLGAEQREWLLEELAAADDYGLVVWVNGSPWVGEAETGNDTWQGFAEERRTIADAIAEYDVDNLFMVSGDAHMLAYDDGTNTDYSESGDAGFPLLHAASLDRIGSIKGGPYSGEVIPGGGQFGLVHVEDDGTTVDVTLEARTWQDEVLFTESFSVERS